ncbi:MAG: glycerol-3-phosphate 1-O-acyltransferase PlsY [Gammaproteobacteria bacterium]|nr:glycerol-3-phosphate 1-O-acyltransferase PlsY [Gammaproteobacteria bacterium]NNF67690.1 glycerol-3-phosphate 1-O-acyltransferase PlsY [Gammaproteobacteria bacterium]
MLELGTKILLSYLLGSVNGSLLLGRFRGVDIRREGSGNAGATNALRTYGLVFALFVVLIDFGKGIIAVRYVAVMPGFETMLLPLAWTAVVCGLASIVGHIFPFWFDFRGGKGGATSVGALLALWPVAVLPVLIVWVVCLLASGYVGLSTILAAVSMPLFALAYRPDGLSLPLLIFGSAVAVLVIYAHRSNLGRMRDGTESRVAIRGRKGRKRSR